MDIIREKRWELLSIQHEDNTVIVYDYLFKTSKRYFVPYLTSVSLMDNYLNVYTSTQKIMQINLIDSSRKLMLNHTDQKNFDLRQKSQPTSGNAPSDNTDNPA